MFSNYPDGVTGNEPAIAGLQEMVMTVTCEQEECKVVPAEAVTVKAQSINKMAGRMLAGTTGEAYGLIAPLAAATEQLIELIGELEDNGEFSCPFTGEVDVQVDKTQAYWNCPVCGIDNATDLEDPRERFAD